MITQEMFGRPIKLYTKFESPDKERVEVAGPAVKFVGMASKIKKVDACEMGFLGLNSNFEPFLKTEIVAIVEIDTGDLIEWPIDLIRFVDNTGQAETL